MTQRLEAVAGDEFIRQLEDHIVSQTRLFRQIAEFSVRRGPNYNIRILFPDIFRHIIDKPEQNPLIAAFLLGDRPAFRTAADLSQIQRGNIIQDRPFFPRPFRPVFFDHLPERVQCQLGDFRIGKAQTAARQVVFRFPPHPFGIHGEIFRMLAEMPAGHIQ